MYSFVFVYYVIFVPWAGGLFCTIKNLNLNLGIIYGMSSKKIAHFVPIG